MVLIQLDSAELQAALRQAELAAQQARAHVRQLKELQAPMAEQALVQAKANSDNTQRNLERTQELFDKGFLGAAAKDEAQRASQVALAQVRSVREQLASVRLGGSDMAAADAALAFAQAAVDGARSRLSYTQVKAPVGGTLIARNVEMGDVVQPGKVLMTLSPSGAVQLVLDVDEKNLRLITLGQKAQVSADAFAQERFAATVAYINPGVNAQTGAVEVKLDVDHTPAYLRQDMTVSIDIEVARRPQALVLSAAAVHALDSTAPWCWVWYPQSLRPGRPRSKNSLLQRSPSPIGSVFRVLCCATGSVSARRVGSPVPPMRGHGQRSDWPSALPT
jgi:HlyD family secretion protein